MLLRPRPGTREECLPKSPIWEAEVGSCRAEEYHTNARGTHVEIRVGRGHQLVVFPHELKHLRALLDHIEAHRSVPALALDERRMA